MGAVTETLSNTFVSSQRTTGAEVCSNIYQVVQLAAMDPVEEMRHQPKNRKHGYREILRAMQSSPTTVSFQRPVGARRSQAPRLFHQFSITSGRHPERGPPERQGRSKPAAQSVYRSINLFIRNFSAIPFLEELHFFIPGKE